MKISYFQTHPQFLSIQENLNFVEKNIQKIKSDLIVLPEFFNCGYNFQTIQQVQSVAEQIPNGPTTKLLQKLAQNQNITLVAGLVERCGRQLFNSAVAVTPKKIYLYRKIHLFAKEKIFFSPGNTGYPVFEWKKTKIGIMICYDWFFPEACRTLALNGAEIIAHPANLVLPYCPEAMKTRCLENHVFTVTCNRVGKEGALTYIGQSQIVDPWGKILHRASQKNTEFFTVEINPKLARDKKINHYNHLMKDRQTQYYFKVKKTYEKN